MKSIVLIGLSLIVLSLVLSQANSLYIFNMPDSDTLFYNQKYTVLISPAHPTSKDTISIIVYNLSFRRINDYEHKESRILNEEGIKELQISFWHGCSLESKPQKIMHEIKINPLKKPGKYKLVFKSNELYLKERPYDTSKHCFENIQCSPEIVISK